MSRQKGDDSGTGGVDPSYNIPEIAPSDRSTPTAEAGFSTGQLVRTLEGRLNKAEGKILDLIDRVMTLELRANGLWPR